MPANLAEWKMQYRMVFGREPTYADLVQEVTMNGTHHLMTEYQAQQTAASAPPLPPPKPLLQQAQELENSGLWREAANLRYQQQAVHNQVVAAQAIQQMNMQAALASGNTTEAARQEQLLKEMETAARVGTAEQLIQKPEVAQAVAQMNQYQAEAEEAGKQRKYEAHKARKYGVFGPSWKSNGEWRKETMLEQGARHHPIVGGVVSSVVVPAIGMVVAGPIGAISAGATYGAVEHGAEGIPAGAIRGAIYAALAPTAGEALGVNPEGFGGAITGLNGPSLLNQLGVSSAPAIGGGIGLFGNLGAAGLAEQMLVPAQELPQAASSIAVSTTTAAQSINLALTAVEAISSVAPVIGYSYANQLTEPRTTSALQSEQRKKRRREFYRSIVSMGFCAFVASVSAPFLLAGQNSFVIALGEGAIFGGIASGISRRNAAQGAFEGAFFAGLGNIVDRSLSHFECLSEAKRLREALGAAASSTVYIVVHDGKLEDVLIGAGSSALSNFLVPTVTGSVNEETLRVFVTGTVTSLMHRTELAQSLVAAGLGSVQARIQRIARQYGRDITMRQQTRRQPRPVTNDRIENRESSRPSAKNDAWRSNSIKVATQKASEVLEKNNIKVSDKKILRAFEKHPILQGSREEVQRNLIVLGKTDGPVRDNRSAFSKGLEKVFLAVLNTLVGEAHASEVVVSQTTSRRQPSIFERRANLDAQIRQAAPTWSEYPVREFTEWPATGPREAAMALGAAADLGRLGSEFVSGILLGPISFLTDSATFLDELQQPLSRRDTTYTDDFTQRTQRGVYSLGHAIAHPIETGTNYLDSIEQRLQRAQGEYANGNYFTVGVLGNPARPVGEVAPVLFGGVGATRLLYNVSSFTVRATARGITSTAREVRQFVRSHDFISPITFQFNAAEANAVRLNYGIPIDIGLRTPWKKKDVLSERARLYPQPLLNHEEILVTIWQTERLEWMQRIGKADLSKVNSKMEDLIERCYSQLRDHMTPDDFAAILKEQRGVEIPKPNGGKYQHLESEWEAVQQSFQNALEGPWVGSLEEATVLNEQFGNISRLWTRFEKLIERAKCNPESTTLRP